MRRKIRKTIFLGLLCLFGKLEIARCLEVSETDPRISLQLAESEAEVWSGAHVSPEGNDFQDRVMEMENLTSAGIHCFIDGSWKDFYLLSSLGWICTQDNTQDVLMGSKSTYKTLSPLHAELKALLWAMECLLARRRFEVNFRTDCSELVKMVHAPRNWSVFEIYLDDFKKLKDSFAAFMVSYIPRQSNIQADNLAVSARILSHEVSYVNSAPPI